MTEQNTTVHHQTKRGADLALAKRLISPASRAAVLAGEIDLQQAKELGRSCAPQGTAQASGDQRTPTGRRTGSDDRTMPDTPPQPVSRVSKDDTTQECWCGVCGEQTKPGRRFKPGHDQRAKGIIKRAVAAGKADDLSDRLKEYGKERGLI